MSILGTIKRKLEGHESEDRFDVHMSPIIGSSPKEDYAELVVRPTTGIYNGTEFRVRLTQRQLRFMFDGIKGVMHE